MGFLKRLFQKNEDIIARYQRLAAEEKWKEALPVIKEILSRNEEIGTSWFNYAVCLEALEKYDDAIAAFKKAYELDPDDKGIQYRIFRALALKGDPREFTRFAETEMDETPEILGLLQDQDEFQQMVQHKWFVLRMKRFTQQD